MTHDQAQAIAVECMHRLGEQLWRFDANGGMQGRQDDIEAFVDEVRKKIRIFNEAWADYQDVAD